MLEKGRPDVRGVGEIASGKKMRSEVSLCHVFPTNAPSHQFTN